MAVVNEAWVSRRDDLWLFAAPPLALLLGGCDGVEEVLRSHQIAVPHRWDSPSTSCSMRSSSWQP